MEPESRQDGEGESPCLSSGATPFLNSFSLLFLLFLLCYSALYLLLFLLSPPLFLFPPSLSYFLFLFCLLLQSYQSFVFSLFSLFISIPFPLLCLFYVSTSPLSLSPFYLPSSHFTVLLPFLLLVYPSSSVFSLFLSCVLFSCLFWQILSSFLLHCFCLFAANASCLIFFPCRCNRS